MATEKEDFKAFVTVMGWNKSETARRLGITSAAANHLLNPNHPNKPRETTMKLLKMIVAAEKPEAMKAVIATGKLELREDYISEEERKLVHVLRDAPEDVREGIKTILGTHAYKKKKGGAKKAAAKTAKLEDEVDRIDDASAVEDLKVVKPKSSNT